MSKVIMTSQDLIERLRILAARRTFYRNKYPYNLCRINEDKRTSADCVNLYKALLNGYDVYKSTIGYYQKDLSNTGDCSEQGLLNQCTDISIDFTRIADGKPRALWMNGHFGGSIPTVTMNNKRYNVIECTPSFGGGIIYSWVDPDGTRRACQGGTVNGKWLKNGLFTPFVNYNAQPTTVDVSGYPELKKGSTGNYVAKLQILLSDKGYDPNGIDGCFGNGCDSAVKRYQKDNSLDADGIVGQKTWNSLVNGSVSKPTTQQPKPEPKPETPKKEDVSKYPVLKNGSSGTYVKRLQTLLRENGYLIKVDGKFGDKTKNAVEKYQKKKNLKVDGIVGPKTWDKLING